MESRAAGRHWKVSAWFATIIYLNRSPKKSGYVASNPFCSPRFRLSGSGMRQLNAFAFGVPYDINGFHPYTVGSISLSHPLVLTFPARFWS